MVYAYTKMKIFPKYLQTTDAITKSISKHKYSQCMLAQDNLQIYVDTDELIVRPFEFGTDAIERQRTATATAQCLMLTLNMVLNN